jgi:hypothetical protein
MPAPIPCQTSCCPEEEIVNTPGPTGADGTAGTDGDDGLNAFSFTTEDFTIPAIGANVTIAVTDSTWMTAGQTVYVEGAGFYEVISKSDSSHATIQRLDVAENTFTGNVAFPVQVSPAGAAGPSAIGALPNPFTDNSGGTPSDTINAGVGIQVFEFPHTFIGGTSAVEPVTTWTPGFNFEILSWSFVTEVLLVGAAGSRVANMEINGTDVGTVPSTITIPIANATVGTVTAGTAVAGANTGGPGDSFSIEIASGGTQFTAGSGTFVIRVRNMDSVNAIASLADHINDLIAALP